MTSPSTAQSPAPAPQRLAHLDGLRGAAALVVLVYHGFLVLPGFSNPEWGIADTHGLAWLDYSPLRILLSGTEAVLIFFVLSGLVLTLPVLRSPRFSWKAYYPSRLLRLYLPVFGALIWAVAVILLLPRLGLLSDPSIYMKVHAEEPSLLRIARDAILVDGANSLDDPLWSLQWEVLFSLLLPLYVFAARRVARAWLPLTLVIAAVTAAASIVGRPSLTYLPAFAIGVLFAVSYDRLQELARRINAARNGRAIWIGLTVVASLLLTARWTLAPIVPEALIGGTMFPVLLGAALFVVIALGSPGAQQFLTTPILRWLSMVSFSLYLTHEPVVVGIAQLLPGSLEPFTVIIATPVSLAIGWLFYLVVERPSHRLSQAVKRRLAPTVKENRPTTPELRPSR